MMNIYAKVAMKNGKENQYWVYKLLPFVDDETKELYFDIDLNNKDGYYVDTSDGYLRSGNGCPLLTFQDVYLRYEVDVANDDTDKEIDFIEWLSKSYFRKVDGLSMYPDEDEF